MAFLGDEDRFHPGAVPQGEHEFPAAIGGLQLLLHLELADDGPSAQLLPEAPGDVGHLPEVEDSLVEPLEQLAAAEGRLAPSGRKPLHVVKGEFLQIDGVGHMKKRGQRSVVSKQ